MQKYRLISKKGEGTFSEVLKAQSIKDGRCTAIKCMKSQFESAEQVNHLREIQALRRLSPHPHIIKLIEVLFDQPSGRLALVFELMDMNIYELIRGRRHYLPEHRIRNYMYQLLKSMDHMHRNGIFHRDIKPENILILDDQLKLADFGSCRGIYSKQPYTEYISTRWYRAPECLLTDGYYNYKMDMWGVGCVFFEVMSLYPLFPGANELDQINKIHKILGTPPAEVLAKFKRHASHVDFNFPHQEGTGIAKLIPHASADAIDLMQKLLCYNPDDRISARQALRHPFFRDIRDVEKVPRSPMSGEGAPQKEERTTLPPAVKHEEQKKEADKAQDGKRTLPSIHSNVVGEGGGHEGGGTTSEDDELPPIRMGATNQSVDGKGKLPTVNVAGGGEKGKKQQKGQTSKKYKQPTQMKPSFPGVEEVR
mmetsp:Transcript_18150/g.45309  ORF Transcript_18150/g.45309 Transcript_18150/m.45309 type:complete len:423 (-) Transcript_18150:732-2000(-)